jgi:hypothetical protein
MADYAAEVRLITSKQRVLPPDGSTAVSALLGTECGSKWLPRLWKSKTIESTDWRIWEMSVKTVRSEQ